MLEAEQKFQALVNGLRVRDRRAVATALTHLEIMSPTAGWLRAEFGHKFGRAPVIGVTGPPGAGKSTVVNALIAPLRKRRSSVAIIAVDPSSPFSAGAILGDRLRMTAAGADGNVFIRSLAAQGSLGGIAPSAVRLIDGFDAAGFELVILETVGTGQTEIDIAEIADIRVVVCAPGLGDHIQAMKSGLLEIADILVVNKADRPDADATRQQLAGAVSLRTDEPARVTPVVMMSALRGDGVADLIAAIDSILETRKTTLAISRRRFRARYLIARAASDLIAAKAKALEPVTFDEMADDLLSGRIDLTTAATRLINGA